MSDMKKYMIVVLAVLGALFSAMAFSACADKAEVASENISKACDNFECNRRIVMFNAITDKYLMVVEGRCSIESDNEDNQLEVTCKRGEDQFTKDFFGLSDNVSYFVQQSETIDVSEYHYRVTFTPQQIIPDPDFQGSSEDTPLSPENGQ